MSLHVSARRPLWSLGRPRRRDAVEVRLDGDLDIGGVGDVERAWPAVADEPGRFVLVDLSGMTFLDCAGLRALEAGSDQLVARGKSVVWFSPGAPASRLLTALANPLDTVVASRREARRVLRTSSAPGRHRRHGGEVA